MKKHGLQSSAAWFCSAVLAAALASTALFHPALALTLPIQAAEQEGWVKTNGSWSYYEGGYPLTNQREWVNGQCYAFDSSGRMIQGLCTLDGRITYHTSSGEALCRKWKKIDGNWYYFQDPEAAADDFYSIDGHVYCFDAHGVMKTGWVKRDGAWFYFLKDGSMACDRWLKLSGKWYLFDSYGEMMTGFVADMAFRQYYLYPDGALAMGTFRVDDMVFTTNADGMIIDAKAYVDPANFLTKAQYDQKVSAFIQEPDYRNGAVWNPSTQSKLTEFPVGACDGYAFDFLMYVFGYDATSFVPSASRADVQNYTEAEKKNASTIQAGDVLGLDFDTYGQHSRHVIVVLQRNGNQLTTAEGNMDGRVVISNSWYYIQNNQLCRRASSNMTIDYGTHFLHQ